MAAPYSKVTSWCTVDVNQCFLHGRYVPNCGPPWLRWNQPHPFRALLYLSPPLTQEALFSGQERPIRPADRGKASPLQRGFSPSLAFETGTEASKFPPTSSPLSYHHSPVPMKVSRCISMPPTRGELNRHHAIGIVHGSCSSSQSHQQIFFTTPCRAATATLIRLFRSLCHLS